MKIFKNIPVGKTIKFKKDNLLLWTKINKNTVQCEFDCECKIHVDDSTEVYIGNTNENR